MHRNIANARPVAAVQLSAAIALGITVAAPASAATKEVDLATQDRALAYCESGRMPGLNQAYIRGASLVQLGPDALCAQVFASGVDIKKSILVKGKRASECNLSSAAQAITFCNAGGMGEDDIAYIAGKAGETISGPGYGCIVSLSSGSIRHAICK
jgi:hypothetical protein